MVKITEGTFSVEGASLYTKTWLPDGPPKAKMVMVHGFSDHVNRYYGFFPYLAERGIAVHGFDQRGWGRSVRRAGDRGKTGPTRRVVADIAAFVRSVAANNDAPVFVLGHSMGGGEVLALASAREENEEGVVARVRGWLLEAPFLGFAPELEPHWLTVAGGRVASRVAPSLRLARPIPPEHLSRDPEVQRSLAADALCHDTGTLEGLAGMLDRTEGLTSGALRLSPKVRSLLLLHGTSDRATSFERSRAWFDRFAAGGKIEDATFKGYEGMYHQLHADHGREQFYKDVADWILERVDNGGSGSGSGDGSAEETKGEGEGEAASESKL